MAIYFSNILQEDSKIHQKHPKTIGDIMDLYGFMGYPWIIHENSGFWNPALDDLKN
jgi:hypothetical protein